MKAYLLKRLIFSVPLVWFGVTVVFFLARFMPGGPFDRDRALPEEVKAQVLAKYHLDESLPQQYFRYLGQLAQGDLGPSFAYPDRDVAAIILEGLPASLMLGILSLALALAVGVPLGSWAALKGGGSRMLWCASTSSR